MVQMMTVLRIADNTGAKTAMCVKVLGGSRRRYAGVGDVIVVAVKSAAPRGTVRRHAVERAVVVRTRKELGRADGSYVRFDENAAVIIDKDLVPKGTRVFGPVARELKERFPKIVSLAPEVL